MGKQISYRSQSVEVAAGITDRPISIPHRVIEIHVPANTINATVKFGDAGAESVPLTPGGRNRYCFVNPPSKLFITAPGGDALTIFGSEEVEPAFFPFASNAGALRNEIIATWPEHVTNIATGAAVSTPFGFNSSTPIGVMWGAKTGTAADSMELFDGRLCYEARPTTINPVAIRQVSSTFGIHMPLTQLLLAGQEATDFSRVYWDTLWMQQTGNVVLDLDAGLMFGFFPNPGGLWINEANAVGWGLFIQVDGTWAYAANRVNTGPFSPDELVPLAITSAPWRRFDILHIPPTRTRRARLLIYIDAVLRIEREWASGAGPLPDYFGTAAHIERRTAGNAAVTVAMTNLFRVASCSFRRGQLQFDGTFV